MAIKAATRRMVRRPSGLAAATLITSPRLLAIHLMGNPSGVKLIGRTRGDGEPWLNFALDSTVYGLPISLTVTPSL